MTTRTLTLVFILLPIVLGFTAGFLAFLMGARL
jgi:hypothetical protein